MKIILALLALLLCMGFYSFYGIYEPEKAQATQAQQKVIDTFDGLTSLKVVSGSGAIDLENRDGLWWTLSPFEYIGNQEFISKTLRIMEQTAVERKFPMGELQTVSGDKSTEAFIEFIFRDGRRVRIELLRESGPRNTIYLKDKDNGVIFVVPNLWAQFLYFPPERFYSPYFPVPGEEVLTLSYELNQKLIWSVEPRGENLVITHGQKKREEKRSDWNWFFRKLGNLKLEKLDFQSKPPNLEGYPAKFLFATNKGNIIINSSSKGGRIWIPRFKVFARIDPYWLKSLDTEIGKVLTQ